MYIIRKTLCFLLLFKPSSLLVSAFKDECFWEFFLFYRGLIEGNAILGCDAISPGKWLPSFEAPCHLHFKDPKSTIRHGRWNLRNVGKLSPNDEASHPKKTGILTHIFLPSILRVFLRFSGRPVVLCWHTLSIVSLHYISFVNTLLILKYISVRITRNKIIQI